MVIHYFRAACRRGALEAGPYLFEPNIHELGELFGETDILLQEGSEFKIVDRLLTNFHQPESTLLALVAGFSDLSTVKRNYAWAIERRFRLFSYGDLSVWASVLAGVSGHEGGSADYDRYP